MNYLNRHVIEGEIERRLEVTGKRRRRRRKQLLDDLKEKRRYCKFKEEALERTLGRTHFGKSYGPVVRQSTQLWLSIPKSQKLSLPLKFCGQFLT
jgi:hypothetical protein